MVVTMASMEKNKVKPASDHWYALSVFARQEKAADSELRRLGFETYLPLNRVRRCWSDRIQELRIALFPGYMFVRTHLDAERRVRMIRLKQVIDLVGRSVASETMIAAAISDDQMLSLMTVVESHQEMEPINQLIKGTEVKILRGVFKGATGIVEQEPSGKRKLIVQIPILGRGVRTEVCADDLLSMAELSA